MSIEIILIIVLLVILLGGFRGGGGRRFSGTGYYGGGGLRPCNRDPAYSGPTGANLRSATAIHLSTDSLESYDENR